MTFLKNSSVTEKCWFNECPTCKDAKMLRSMFSFEEVEPVTWHFWKKDGDDKLCKMVMEGTTDDLFNHICSELPAFLKHCYIKRCRAKSYQMEREAVEVKILTKHML